MRFNIASTLSVVLVSLLAGCSMRLGDFTIMSTRNIDMSRIGQYERGPRLTGEHVAHIILFVPTVFQPNIEDAVEDAIRRVPGGVAMVDVIVRRFAWWFLYGQAGWTVEGTVLVDPTLEPR